MTTIDTEFRGSIPDIYDSHLVPILFEGYGADLARRVARDSPGAVLEIAAGTGAVTRAMAPLLDEGARYVVTDLNEAMLARAQAHHWDDRIEWRQADALALPFGDDSFDVAFCQFGVMFFPDRVAGFSEIRRVLRPGGRFVFNSWGPIERNDFSNIATETLTRIWPEDPPLFLARTPFGYADSGLVEADLRAAGFEEATIEEVERDSLALADDFAFGQTHGSPLRLEIEARGTPKLAEVRQAITDAIEQRLGASPVRGRMLALVAEAVA